MGDKVKDFLEKAKGLLKRLPKKIIIIAAAVLAVVIVAAVVVLGNKPYAVLVTEVSNEEAVTIMNLLDEMGVTDYRLEGNDTILVPESQEAQLKARLLVEGYPKTGFSYETYFANVGALSTEAERNTAYIMALEEKMAAVIRCMDGVVDATVDMQPGEDRTYVLDSSNAVEATAAVFVTMRDGVTLTNQQASAIRSFVAHSVKGLEIGSVMITDNLGNMYTAEDGSAATTELSALKLQLEEENNNKIRTGIMQVLVPLFGEDNVRVSVHSTVDVNPAYEDRKTTTLPEGSTDGEGLPSSELYDHSIVRGNDTAVGGVVGNETNADLPGYVENQAQVDGTEQEIHVSGQNDYVYNESVERIERVAGNVTDCTVSVSINSTTAGNVDVEALREHVARAACISDADAATSISILPMAFYSPDAPSPILPGSPIQPWVVYTAAGGLLLFLLLAIVIAVVSRRRRRKKELAAAEAAEAQDRATVAELLASIPSAQPEQNGADVMSLNTEKSMELRKEIRHFADDNPEIAAQIIRTLLRGGEENA